MTSKRKHCVAYLGGQKWSCHQKSLCDRREESQVVAKIDVTPQIMEIVLDVLDIN